jgi:hypothetical protein
MIRPKKYDSSVGPSDMALVADGLETCRVVRGSVQGWR